MTARRKKYDWSDVSPIMSGLLLALLMPASLPYTVMIFASAFMSLICKNAFGGNKNLIFCPVCISYIFTTFCFPSYVLRYPTPIPFGSLSPSNTVAEVLGHSYTYALDNGAASAFSLLDIIWGKLSGPMGASAILIIFIAGIALYFFGDIPAPAFFAGFGANVLINVLYPVGEPGWYAVLNSLVAGSYLFVLVFMACDPRYVPRRMFSQALYGVIFALASYYVRKLTNIENAAVFVLPLLCVFRGEMDRLTDLLEKILRFIWKYLLIVLSKIRVILSKLIDKLSSFIAIRLHEAKKRREMKYSDGKAPEPKEPEEPLKLTVSEIVIVNDDNQENQENQENDSEDSVDSDNQDNKNNQNQENGENSEEKLTENPENAEEANENV